MPTADLDMSNDDEGDESTDATPVTPSTSGRERMDMDEEREAPTFTPSTSAATAGTTTPCFTPTSRVRMMQCLFYRICLDLIVGLYYYNIRSDCFYLAALAFRFHIF